MCWEVGGAEWKWKFWFGKVREGVMMVFRNVGFYLNFLFVFSSICYKKIPTKNIIKKCINHMKSVAKAILTINKLFQFQSFIISFHPI